MEKIKIEDLFNFKSLSEVNFSPSGRYIAYVLTKIDKNDDKYKQNIWLYDRNSKKLYQLTSSESDKALKWLDDETLMFTSSRDPKDEERKQKGEPFTKFYTIKVTGGEAQLLFEIPLYVSKIEKLDEKNYLLTAIYDRNMPYIPEDEKAKEETLKKIKEEKDYTILDEIPFWWNGEGFTNGKRNRLYLYNGKKLEPLTDEYTNVETFVLNKEKTKALVIVNRFKDKMEIKTELWLLDLQTKKVENLTHTDPFQHYYADFLEDKIFIVGTDMKTFGLNENPKFYVLDPQTQSVKRVAEDFIHVPENTVGADSRYGSRRAFKVFKNHLYFIVTEHENAYLYRIDISGKIEKLTENSGSVDDFDITEDLIAFVAYREQKLQELYTFANNIETQLTNHNDWLKERQLSVPEKIAFKSKDGTPLEGFVMKPVDFDSNKKYPAILFIHGGPKTVYGTIYYHDFQVMTANGYVVIYTNPRGSDGWGDEFADIRGKYGTIDYEDLMSFVDTVIEKFPFIDENRLGVTGGSYGGFMTNWIVGHTDRFKAAVAERSISNWISKFCTTDIGYYFNADQIQATPWNNFEKLWWHSPLKYADKVKTPTLVVHSDEDYRCWLAEGLQFFTALKYYGVEAKMVIFHGENHDLSRNGKPSHRVRRVKEIFEWFERFLK